METNKPISPIDPAADAIEGEVRALVRYTTGDFVLGSAILCRQNAPLVAFAYGLLRRDVPCRILGRDIGAGLCALVRKLCGTTALPLDQFLARVTSWESREANRAIAEDRNPDTISDQANCLRFFVSDFENEVSADTLCARIDRLFADSAANGFDSRVTLSTVHKAKGLEFPTVFLLDRHLIPSRYAKQRWQRVQERNLLYVAVTRAKERLLYIQSDSWKD